MREARRQFHVGIAIAWTLGGMVWLLGASGCGLSPTARADNKAASLATYRASWQLPNDVETYLGERSATLVTIAAGGRVSLQETTDGGVGITAETQPAPHFSRLCVVGQQGFCLSAAHALVGGNGWMLGHQAGHAELLRLTEQERGGAGSSEPDWVVMTAPVVLSHQFPLAAQPRVGDVVFVMGRSSACAAGTIQSMEELEGMRIIRFNAPVIPGDSGGPVVNVHGELVAMTIAIENSEGSRHALGILPVRRLRELGVR